VALGCSITVCLCFTLRGQDLDTQAKTVAAEFGKKNFMTACPGHEQRYVGPFSTAKLFCADVTSHVPTVCQQVMEYENLQFVPRPQTPRTPADRKNNVWRWSVIADFEVFRLRHIADGTWGPWTEWRDKDPKAAYEVMKLTYEDTNKKWLWEPGDDVTSFVPGWSLNSNEPPACADILNSTKHSQPLSELDSVQCRDSLNQRVPVQKVLREDARRWCGITPERWDELNGKHTTTSAPTAPEHSLNDTYAQAQTIAQANASKGIRDSVNPSYIKALHPLFVCYSIDATGTCQKSGENIWLPGDLAQPLDWNKLQQAGACRPPQPDQIEVVLKSTVTDDKRKRYIRCGVAAILASARKDLISLGVKDDGPTATASALPPVSNAPAVPPSSPPAPGSNSLEIAAGKDAVTTRAFPDPRGKGPGCEIPEGTLALIQSIDKQTGKVQLFVLPNDKRAKNCTNFLTVDRTDLRGIAGYPTPK
jgi:hypothetical protein